MKRKFSKELLQDIVSGFTDEFTIEQSEIVEHTRWSVVYSCIFKEEATGKFYSTTYSRGATEQQDERPYEYEGDEIEVDEVKPVEKTVITYVKV